MRKKKLFAFVADGNRLFKKHVSSAINAAIALAFENSDTFAVVCFDTGSGQVKHKCVNQHGSHIERMAIDSLTIYYDGRAPKGIIEIIERAEKRIVFVSELSLCKMIEFAFV